MMDGLRRLREPTPPRMPGVLAPEYGASVAVEIPLARIAELVVRTDGSRR